MPNKYFRSARTMNYQRDPVRVTGSFSATVAGVTAGTVHGDGFAVARTGLGTYVVTLADQFRHCLHSTTDLGLTVPVVDLVAHGAPVVALGAACTLTITIHDTAAVPAAFDPPNGNDRVAFSLLLSNSGMDT